MTTISHHLRLVHDRINAASLAAGRDPSGVRLLAVSKTFDADAVIEAVQAGQRAFGENYIAEGVEKIDALRRWHADETARTGVAAAMLEWHCIGPIQSNKTRLVAEHFDWAQSVDRLKIAQRLSEQRPTNLPPLKICLQVNISGEASKSGCTPEELPALAAAVTKLTNLQLCGLMAIPEPSDDLAQQRAACAQLRQLASDLQPPLATLSMGMSHDLEAAIAEGATWVRIGTALFGARDYATPHS